MEYEPKLLFRLFFSPIVWDLTYLLNICQFFELFILYLQLSLIYQLFEVGQFIYLKFILKPFFFALHSKICLNGFFRAQRLSTSQARDTKFKNLFLFWDFFFFRFPLYA